MERVDRVAAGVPPVVVVLLGLVVGLVGLPGTDVVLLSLWLLLVGGMLTFAFRSRPGAVCGQWRRARWAGSPLLYRLYERLGPWAWRLGAGMGAGQVLSTVA